MKKLILILTILLALTIRVDAIGAQWTLLAIGDFYREDRFGHTMACDLITQWSEGTAQWEINGSKPLASFLLITAISLAKEGVDNRTGGAWDNGDILANYIGWVLPHMTVTFRF